jgi:glycosyltransferase involved in cell wall biosynthesis
MMTLRIGHTERGYQQMKNLVGHAPGCKYILVRDYYSALRRLHELARKPPFLERSVADSRFKFQDHGLNRIDLVHLYNGVSYGSRPWVSTFETMLPRFRVALKFRLADPMRVRREPEVVRALEHLAGPACRRLISRSHNSIKFQSELLDVFPEYRDAIMRKIQVIPVAQTAYYDPDDIECAAFAPTSPIRFMFVGHAFFRKGGREVLEALDSIRADGLPVELVLVSGLGLERYINNATSEHVVWAKRFISERRDWIVYHRSLPNESVKDLMRTCHVGLLPSLAEPYGLSVLEFQAHGVPVVTTDVRSFPEINDDECGWIIRVPRQPNGEGIFNSPGGIEKMSRAIRAGLDSILREIYQNPEVLASRRRKALERICSEHDPTKVGTKLRNLYDEALEGHF